MKLINPSDLASWHNNRNEVEQEMTRVLRDELGMSFDKIKEVTRVLNLKDNGVTLSKQKYKHSFFDQYDLTGEDAEHVYDQNGVSFEGDWENFDLVLLTMGNRYQIPNPDFFSEMDEVWDDLIAEYGNDDDEYDEDYE